MSWTESICEGVWMSNTPEPGVRRLVGLLFTTTLHTFMGTHTCIDSAQQAGRIIRTRLYCRYRDCPFHACKVTDSSQYHTISQICQQAVNLLYRMILVVNSNINSGRASREDALSPLRVINSGGTAENFSPRSVCHVHALRGVFNIRQQIKTTQKHLKIGGREKCTETCYLIR